MGMRARIAFMFLLTTPAVFGSNDVQGAQYLQDTIKDLRNHMNVATNRRDTQIVTPSPIKRAYNKESNVPSLQLTKAELAALYETAATKGETIKFDPGDGSPQHVNAVIHEIGDDDDTSKKGHEKENSGYYYYYYPLKSFMDELSSSAAKPEKIKLDQYVHHDYHHHPKEVPKPHLHSHTHQHNVHIEPMKNTMDMDKKSKGLEPLFMAISGFIGMTIMFILSILVLPKFEKLKPKGFKDEGMEMTSITRVAIEAIEGRDCSERIACEVGKAANALNLYDNRFVKLVRRVGPYSLGKRIDKIGKYTDKKFKCASIQCKRKGAGAVQQKAKQKLKKQ